MTTVGNDSSRKNMGIETSIKVWRKRLVCAKCVSVEHMIHRQNYGMRVATHVGRRTCEKCLITIQCKASCCGSFLKNTRSATVHVNICGTISVKTYGGK